MFERFTDQARFAVVAACEESRRCGHPTIDTEHLLLGLLHTNDTAFQLLERAGFTVEEMRSEVLAPPATGSPEHIPFSSEVKKVLVLSLEEAVQLRDDFIGTEHILLGLLREGGGSAGEALQRRGVQLDEARRTVAAIDRNARRGGHKMTGTLRGLLRRTRRQFG